MKLLLRAFGMLALTMFASSASAQPLATTTSGFHQVMPAAVPLDSVMTITVPSIEAAPTLAHRSLPANTSVFTLTAALAAMGATASSKGPRKMNLSKSYLFNDQVYGPGNDIEVPDDFPEIDDETGDPIFPPGSIAARNLAASARANGTGVTTSGGALTAGTSGSGPGTGRTVSGLSADELEAMTKDDLQALAAKNGLTVTRGDGTVGDPLKSDYVTALGATATA